MSNFGKMKKNRMSFEQLSKKVDADKSGGFKADPRFYYPQLDENKNGQAVIRFLPECDGEDDQWIKVYSHGFKDKGGWYIDECPTTVSGGKCPVCESNSEYWNSGIESDKEIARKRKRRMQYMANVLVVEDKKNPENEGKVFLFKFGAKIFDKVKGALHPEFDDDVGFNPFDFWEGANFKLRIRKFEGNVNYDKCEFDTPAPIAKTDKAIEAIWNQQHKLGEFLSEDRFKSYDEMSKRFNRVIGAAATTTTASEMSEDAGQEKEPEQKSAPAKSEPAAEKKVEKTAEASGDEEDPMAYFRQLQEEDS